MGVVKKVYNKKKIEIDGGRGRVEKKRDGGRDDTRDGEQASGGAGEADGGGDEPSRDEGGKAKEGKG